ncbi:hypothetical protein COL154_001620 [Colletotrichum chrysophilum]|nr:hypothetical protein COL154_001620 [Colletotrichum chrysophilum]
MDIDAKAKADRERKKEKEEKEENNKKKSDEEKKNEEENNDEDYDKDGNLVPRVGPKTLALYHDEETGDYVGEVIAKVEQQKVEQQTKHPYSKPAPQRKPRTNLSLLKPIPAFPGYKKVNIPHAHNRKANTDTKPRDPDLRIKENWTLPVDQVDWKPLQYREVMRSRETGEWHRSQYKLAVKDRKEAWKKASRRLKEGRGVVMTEAV